MTPAETPPEHTTSVTIDIWAPGARADWALRLGGELELLPAASAVLLDTAEEEYARFRVETDSEQDLLTELLSIAAFPAERMKVAQDGAVELTLLPPGGAPATAIAPPLPPARARAAVQPARPRPAPRVGLASNLPGVAAPAFEDDSEIAAKLETHFADSSADSGLAPVERVSVSIGPFNQFTAVNEFLLSLQKFPQVARVRPRRFRRGTLYFVIEYTGTLPIDQCLSAVPGVRVRINSIDATRLELRRRLRA